MRVGIVPGLFRKGFRQIAAFKKVNPALPMPSSLPNIVTFGDSITFGVGASTTAKNWANLVANALGATLLNQGISGTVLQNSPDASGSPRADNGRDRYVSALTGANKKAGAFIAYCLNDLRYTAAPLTFNTANMINDYREILDGLLAAGYTQDRLFIISPHYITDTGLQTGSTGFTGQTRAGYEDGVAKVKALAMEYGTYYADSYGMMRDNGGASLITNDNIHPNDAGHQMIANAVLAAKRIPKPLPPDTVAPTITSAATASVVEGNALNIALTANETVTWAKVGGADAALFTLNGSTLTLPAKTFASPGDSDANNTYIVQVRATDTAGNATTQTITATVTKASSSFFLDNFNGADGDLLSAHVSDSGHTWTPIGGLVPSTQAKIVSNRLYNPADAAGNVQRSSAVAASKNYWVKGVLRLASVLSGDNVAINIRSDPTANTYYWAGWSQSTGVWRLFKTVNGTATSLAPTVAANLVVGNSYELLLTANESTITLAVNGTTIITATDASIVAPGSPGIRMASVTQSPTTGMQIESLEAGLL